MYGPTDCVTDNAPDTNTLLGGVNSGGCANWGHHPVFILFELLGLFIVVALVIAVFESFYGERTNEGA